MYEAGTARLKAAEEKEEKEVLARKNRVLNEDDMSDDEGDVKEDDDILESPIQDESSPSLDEITGMFGQSKWMSQGLDDEEIKSLEEVVPRLEVKEPSSPPSTNEASEDATPKSSSADPTPEEEPSTSDLQVRAIASEVLSKESEAKDPATEESKSESKSESKREEEKTLEQKDTPSDQPSSTLEKVEHVRQHTSLPTKENTTLGSSDLNKAISTQEQVSSEPSTPRSNSPFVFSRMGSLSDDGLGLVSAMTMPTTSTLSCIPLTSNDSSGPSMPIAFLSTCAPFSVWSSPSFTEPPETSMAMTGSFQARRKRERDGDTTLKTVLRIPSSLAPHYLTSGRVTKRQRYV